MFILFTMAGIRSEQVVAQCGTFPTAWLSTPNLELNLVTDFGADPTGVVNAFRAFQCASKWIRDREGDCILRIPAGTYLVNTQNDPVFPVEHVLRLVNDPSINIAISDVMVLGDPSGGTVIQFAAGLRYGYFDGLWQPQNGPGGTEQTPKNFIFVYGADDITIRDLHVYGGNTAIDSGGHLSVCTNSVGACYRGIESSGLSIKPYVGTINNINYQDNAEHITVERCTFSNFCFDGVYIGNGGGTQPRPYDITLNDVVCEYNSRQGMSVTAAATLTINRCRFNYTATGGVLKNTPACGIDFEPNAGWSIPPIENITISDCEALGNLSSALVLQPTGGYYSQNITFTRCRFGDYDNYEIDSHDNSVEACAQNLTFDDCEFEGKVEAGFYALNLAEGILFKNCRFSDRENALGNYRSGFVFRSKYDTRFLQYENCAFTAIHGGHGIMNCMTFGPINGAADPNHYTRFTDCRFTHADYSSGQLANESSFMRGCRFAGHTQFINMHSSGRNIVFSGLVLEGGNYCEAAFFEGSGFDIKNCQDYLPGNDVLSCPGNPAGCITYPGFEIGQTGEKVLAKISKGSLTVEMNANSPIVIEDNDVLQVGASCGLNLNGEVLQNNGGLLAYQHAEPTLNIGDLNYSGTNTSWLFVDKRLPLNAITATGATNFNGQCVLGENGNLSPPCQPNYSNLLIGRSFQVLYKVVPGNSCAGTCSIAIRGGSGNYSVSLDNVNTGGNTFSLTAGDHQLSIADITNSCTEVFDLHPDLQWLSPAEFYLGCDPNAQVKVEAMAENTVSYAVNGGTSNTTGIFTGLAAGIYTVTATDLVTNCVSTRIIRVFRPTAGMCCAQPLVSDEETILMSGNAADVLALFGLGNPVQNKTILVDGTLQVSQSLTFQDCHFFFTPGSQIQVDNGVDLTLNASELQAACNGLWKGITADNSTEQIILNDCTLRDMEDGVTVLNNAKVFATNNHFVDNYYGIRIINSTSVPQQVELNTFSGLHVLLPPKDNEELAYCGVYVQNSTGIDIGNPAVPASGNLFAKMRNGITVVMAFPYMAPPEYTVNLYHNHFRNIEAGSGVGWNWNTYANNRGWAVYAQGYNQQLGVLPKHSKLRVNVSGEEFPDPNADVHFNQCDKGIFLRHASGTVRFQTMNRTSLGIAMNECQGKTYWVRNNTLKSVIIGIIKNGDESSSGCNIYHNTITLYQADPVGYIEPGLGNNYFNQAPEIIYFQPTAISSTYSNDNNIGLSKIWHNTVNMAVNHGGVGIGLSNSANALVTNNYVHVLSTMSLPGLSGYPPAIRGINSNISEKLRLIGNVIDNNFSVNASTTYAPSDNVGIYLHGNANSLIHCNIANFLRYGLCVIGQNGSFSDYSLTAGNTTKGSHADWVCWRLGNEGTMGQVGKEVSASPLVVFDANNRFLGQAGLNHVYRKTPCSNSYQQDQIVTAYATLNPSQSSFSVTQNNANNDCRVPVYNPATITQTFDCAVAYPNTGSMDNPVQAVGTPWNNQGEDYIFALMVAMDTMQYEEFPDGTRQANQEMIYAWLRANDSLRNSHPVLDSFYLSHFTGAIGHMNRVDALLAMLSDSTLMADSTAWLDTLNAVRVLNNQLTDTNQFIANARWVNGRYMDMLQNSIDTLLGETADSMEALANACPLIAGKAVYRARALLGMLLPGLHYDDLVICNAQGVFKQGQQLKGSEEKHDRQNAFILYPNPASELINVSYYRNGTPDFFDLLGRKMASYKVVQVGSMKFNVANLPRGILTYKFSSNDGEIFVGKLILE